MRVIRLPRHGASCPVAIAVSCSADRQALGKITADGVFLEQLETDPARFLPEVTDEHLSDDVVHIDLNRPMTEIRAELSQYPVKTRLVADAARWSWPATSPTPRSRSASTPARACPQYLRDHCVYYAGPAKTPEGYASGSFGPTTAGRMDSYVEQFQAAGRQLRDAGQGQPLEGGHRRVQGQRRLLPRLDRRARPPAWPRTASPRSRCSSTPSSAWRRCGRSRCEDFPAFIVVDDKGNDFFADVSRPIDLAVKRP